jgi:uncharacterized LabA/DUF88 family protein
LPLQWQIIASECGGFVVSFNTAVFYDIENLLKGYSFSGQTIANLSLTEILSAVRQTDLIGQIAIQRAYANWSDPRLTIMRSEINELGIDPIQVFGFAREHKKNAADIQLAIDAIDIAHIRPSLDVFVIVSGDGGFAALAKKLHEYGKTVVGCAYQNAANRTFQAVCDRFVRVAEPSEDERQRPSGSIIKTLDGIDPRNARLIANVRRPSSNQPEELAAKTREILNWYANDRTCRSDLLVSGIHLSVIQQAISQIIPDLQPIRFGFAKFIEYMQYVCSSSELCIARIPPSQVVLRLRNAALLPDVDVLPDLAARTAHSLETYQSILAAGSPIYRLPPLPELYNILSLLVANPFQKVDLATATTVICSSLEGKVSAEAVKMTLLSAINAGLFMREPESAQVSEQRLTLQPEVLSLTVSVQMLREAIGRKIGVFLAEDVEPQILNRILPDSST